MIYKQVVIDDLLWEADFRGEEFGYDQIPAIGLYTSKSLKLDVLINYDNGRLLEVWSNADE